MKLEDALGDVSAILLDTAPVIYYLERNPRYAPVMEAFFYLRAKSGIVLITSPITLLECLVHPLQRGLPDLERAYHRLIVAGENTVFRVIGDAEAREAARLRSECHLRLADALQGAVAILSGCQAILTNDSVFKKLAEVRSLILDELEV